MTFVSDRTVVRNKLVKLELAVFSINDFAHNQTGDAILNNDRTRVRELTADLSVTELEISTVERILDVCPNITELIQVGRTDGIDKQCTKLVLTLNRHIRFIGRITANDQAANRKVTTFLDIARQRRVDYDQVVSVELVRVGNRALVNNHVVKRHRITIDDLSVNQAGNTVFNREVTRVVKFAAQLNVTGRQGTHIEHLRNNTTDVAFKHFRHQGRENATKSTTTLNRNITSVIDEGIGSTHINSDQRIVDRDRALSLIRQLTANEIKVISRQISVSIVINRAGDTKQVIETERATVFNSSTD